jgi:phospholipid/cholesterol/gamma-HCH transport system substrate-binding protein
MQQVVNSVPELVNRVTELTEQLAKTVNDQNQAAIAETLANLARVTGTMAAHSDDLGQIMAEGATDARQLHQLIDSLQQATKQLGQATADASTTFRSLNGLVNENREPLKQFTQSGLVELQQLVIDTRGLVARLGRTVDGLDRDPSRLLYGDQRQGYRPQ